MVINHIMSYSSRSTISIHYISICIHIFEKKWHCKTCLALAAGNALQTQTVKASGTTNYEAPRADACQTHKRYAQLECEHCEQCAYTYIVFYGIICTAFSSTSLNRFASWDHCMPCTCSGDRSNCPPRVDGCFCPLHSPAM